MTKSKNSVTIDKVSICRNDSAVIALVMKETCIDRESNELYCHKSESGKVRAWRDNVHEHGTREYGNGIWKSGFRTLSPAVRDAGITSARSSRVEPREYISSRPYV